MKRFMGAFALLVRDYDEAIDYYTDKMGFVLLEDTELGDDKRWVRIAPSSDVETSILLAKASTDRQSTFCGDQAGGRVFLFLNTDDFWRDYNQMKQKGVHFVEEPREEVYGTVVVFQDLYGNKWDLIGPAK